MQIIGYQFPNDECESSTVQTNFNQIVKFCKFSYLILKFLIIHSNNKQKDQTCKNFNKQFRGLAILLLSN